MARGARSPGSANRRRRDSATVSAGSTVPRDGRQGPHRVDPHGLALLPITPAPRLQRHLGTMRRLARGADPRALGLQAALVRLWPFYDKVAARLALYDGWSILRALGCVCTWIECSKPPRGSLPPLAGGRKLGPGTRQERRSRDPFLLLTDHRVATGRHQRPRGAVLADAANRAAWS